MISQITDELPTILGLGSSHGDDQAAWHVIELLQADANLTGRCFQVSTPWDIVGHLKSGGPVVIVDACLSGAPAGTLHRRVSPESEVAAGIVTSSHGGSLREALQLCRSLGYDLSGVVIFGIEVEATEPGKPLSPAVRRATEILANEIRNGWNCRRP